MRLFARCGKQVVEAIAVELVASRDLSFLHKFQEHKMSSLSPLYQDYPAFRQALQLP